MTTVRVNPRAGSEWRGELLRLGPCQHAPSGFALIKPTMPSKGWAREVLVATERLSVERGGRVMTFEQWLSGGWI